MDISIFISLLAVAASLYSLYHAIQTRKDTARAQAIGDFYSTFHEFDKLHLQNWQLGHLFVVPNQYDEVAKQINSRKKYSEDERIEYTLKEKALARFIFDTYENTIYQWQQAINVKDKGRAGFLQEVLKFLTDKTLRNPRLLFLWSLEIENYEAKTIEHYKNYVTDNPENPISFPADPIGPFPRVNRKINEKTSARRGPSRSTL